MAAHVTEHDLEKMEDILAGYGDWFSAYLYRLIAKADFENKAKLRLAFPEHVEAFDRYMKEGRA